MLQSATLEGVERTKRRLAVMAAAGAIGAYAWWAAGLRPFTWPALLAVAVAGMATIVVGTRRRRPSDSRAYDARRVLIWGIVFAVLIGWELAAYFQQPRADHPTLSALVDPVIDWRPARALAFLTWIILGADLSRR